MATEFLNDARKEIEGRTEDFYRELKAFYQGNREAEQNLMEQTTQPFWQSLRLSRKRLQQRELTVDMEMQESSRIADYDGPGKDGYDYTCRRTQSVKMRRTYYRKGKKIAFLRTPEIAAASFLKADVQGDMVVCPNCGHEGTLASYIDGCDACGARFLVSDFETKVSGFSLEEDARQKSISNFIKAGAAVGITAISLAVPAICAGGIMFLLLALGRNGYNAVKAAAAMMLGIGLAPVFFRSLFYMLIIFAVILIVMEVHRKPRIQGEFKAKSLIPEFSTGNFLQNLEYQLRMIHLADTAEQVRFFASCDLDIAVLGYQNVVDCCICGVRFLKAEKLEDSYRISVEVRNRLTLDTGKKIRNRYEKLRLELDGRQDVVTQHSRALREYKCPNCGGSVDILGGGVCEYCNTTVDYRNFGWIITSYTNLGQPENPFAKILAGALGSYLLILFLSLVFMAHSQDGKATFEILQSVRMSTEYLKAVKHDIIYPDAVTSDCTETDSEEGTFAARKVYACEDSDVVKEIYKAALLEKGFWELQQYPEGFSVFLPEDPSEYGVDSEGERFYLVIRAEDASEGIVVTATLMDENFDPVQE